MINPDIKYNGRHQGGHGQDIDPNAAGLALAHNIPANQCQFGSTVYGAVHPFIVEG